MDRSAVFLLGLTQMLTHTHFRVKAAQTSLNTIPDGLLRSAADGVLLVGIDGVSKDELLEVSDLTQKHPCLRTVWLSSRFGPDEFLLMRSAGANGCLLKDEVTAETLLKALDLVLRGMAVLPFRPMDPKCSGERLKTPPVLAAQQPAPSNKVAVVPNMEEVAADLCRLSAREQAILEHLTNGASNKHIARYMNVAEATVKVHIKAILRKLRVHNRTQAAIWAMNNRSTGSDREALRRIGKASALSTDIQPGGSSILLGSHNAAASTDACAGTSCVKPGGRIRGKRPVGLTRISHISICAGAVRCGFVSARA